MLEGLGSSLKDALKKLAGKTVVDRAAVEELVKDLQRALLQADVNVRLVMQLSQAIKTRSLDEEPPKGMAVREHVLRIVYQELVRLMGSSGEVKLGPQTILMAGLQGSGKTTTTAKLARYFQRKGLKTAVICADTFRPGAYEQLSTLCSRINIPCYGQLGETDARLIVRNGLVAKEHAEVVIIDTQGRHALEKVLIDEIIRINDVGPLLPGRIIDLNERAMRYFDPSYFIRSSPANSEDSILCDVFARHAVHQTRPLRVKRRHADPADHDGSAGPGVAGRKAGHGQPGTRGDDSSREEPGVRTTIGEVSEDGLDHGGCDVAGKDEEACGRVRQVILGDEKRQERRQRRHRGGCRQGYIPVLP